MRIASNPMSESPRMGFPLCRNPVPAGPVRRGSRAHTGDGESNAQATPSMATTHAAIAANDLPRLFILREIIDTLSGRCEVDGRTRVSEA